MTVSKISNSYEKLDVSKRFDAVCKSQTLHVVSFPCKVNAWRWTEKQA